MRTPKVTCKFCDKALSLGDDAVYLNEYNEGIYCSETCARKALSEAMDDIYESVASDVTVEEEDPYARYGVNRSDF